MLRPLRISVSIVSGICCVLMVGLWIDSYWYCRYTDVRYYRRQVYGGSFRGVVAVDVDTNQTSKFAAFPDVFWHTSTLSPTNRNYGVVADGLRVISFLGFRWTRNGSIYEADIPFWFLTLITASMAAALWLRWSSRFSLHTLLVAITTAGVLLGIIVYATRGQPHAIP